MVLLGGKIKELRNKYKYTQTELANMVGVTKSTIASYENDTRQPSYEVLIKLAAVFKVTVDYLLLNRSEVILDAHGLNAEQLIILQTIITAFRKNNSIEKNSIDFSTQNPIGKTPVYTEDKQDN